jgi:hypothetical protein
MSTPNTHGLVIPPGTLLAWEATRRAVPHRTRAWYIAASAIVLIMGGYSLAIGNWSTALALFACVLVYAVSHKSAPPLHRIIITHEGFHFDETFTPWHRCNAFWIIETQPSGGTLHIQTAKGKFAIQINGISPHDIHENLSSFIKYAEGKHESFVDYFIRISKL